MVHHTDTEKKNNNITVTHKQTDMALQAGMNHIAMHSHFAALFQLIVFTFAVTHRKSLNLDQPRHLSGSVYFSSVNSSISCLTSSRESSDQTAK